MILMVSINARMGVSNFSSSILQVDRITVCRLSVSSFIRTCLKISTWSSTPRNYSRPIQIDKHSYSNSSGRSYFFLCVELNGPANYINYDPYFYSVEAPPSAGRPLNVILYMPFGIFAYSSKLSTCALAMKLISFTSHPWGYRTG